MLQLPWYCRPKFSRTDLYHH